MTAKTLFISAKPKYTIIYREEILKLSKKIIESGGKTNLNDIGVPTSAFDKSVIEPLISENM